MHLSSGNIHIVLCIYHIRSQSLFLIQKVRESTRLGSPVIVAMKLSNEKAADVCLLGSNLAALKAGFIKRRCPPSSCKWAKCLLEKEKNVKTWALSLEKLENSLIVTSDRRWNGFRNFNSSPWLFFFLRDSNDRRWTPVHLAIFRMFTF